MSTSYNNLKVIGTSRVSLSYLKDLITVVSTLYMDYLALPKSYRLFKIQALDFSIVAHFALFKFLLALKLQVLKLRL